MALVNINNSTDPDFRYKINRIEISKNSTKDGCLTFLKNITEISEQISHNPKTLIKYISITLGTKCNDTDFWIQGHHTEELIQSIIFDFIKIFVLCPKCSVPELQYDTSKHKKISIIKTHCVGCGHDDTIISDTLKKNNKKIFDKIFYDIQSGYFNKSNYTSHIEATDEFILDDDQDFF